MNAHNIVTVDIDSTTIRDGEIFTESVRKWRADCQVGQFKIGKSNLQGSRLDMELVGAQISEGEYFGYPYQKWLGLLFVDREGVLSSILFKTESMDNFEEMRRSYRVNGESLIGKTVRAQMAMRSSRATGTGYYASEFEVVADGKYAEAIRALREQCEPPKVFESLGAIASGE